MTSTKPFTEMGYLAVAAWVSAGGLSAVLLSFKLDRPHFVLAAVGAVMLFVFAFQGGLGGFRAPQCVGLGFNAVLLDFGFPRSTAWGAASFVLFMALLLGGLFAGHSVWCRRQWGRFNDEKLESL